MFPQPEGPKQADIVRFVMAADSNMAPIVGQQVTINAASVQEQLDRWALLEERALVISPREECDLVVRGVLEGVRYSALLQADGRYLDTDGNLKSSAELESAARQNSNTISATCVPPGSGTRIGLDAS